MLAVLAQCLVADGDVERALRAYERERLGPTSAKSGMVTGTACPLHVGRTSHVWELHMTDDAERLICVARLTRLVVHREPRASA